MRSGCPRRSAPAALRAGDFQAGRGAQGAPGAGLGERARVPGVPLPCPAQPARSPNPESVTHWPGAAQGHEVKGACSSFKELAGRSGRQVNGQAAARRGPCVGARRDCSGVTARGWLGPPVSGARPGAPRPRQRRAAARSQEPSQAARSWGGAARERACRATRPRQAPSPRAAPRAATRPPSSPPLSPAGSAARHAGRARGRPRQESGGSRAPKGCCEPDHGPRQPAVVRPSRAGPWPLGAPRVTARPFVPSTRHLRERSPRSAAAAFAACLDGVGRNDEPPAGLRIYVCPLDAA